MIERLLDDPSFEPYAIWTVNVSPSCPKCKHSMSVSKNEKSLACDSCNHTCVLSKSLDDIADDVLMHVKGNKHMNQSKIRKLAEIETDIQKEEAEQ